MAYINITSPGANTDIYANTLTAYNAAVDGDTLVFPTGTFKFTNVITMTKKVSLLGSGIGATILYRDDSIAKATLEGWESFFRIYTNSDIPSGITIDGITFRSQTPSLNDGSDGLSQARDIGLDIKNCVDFRVKNCRFEHFGNAAINVVHRDYLARGVIYDCQFYKNLKRNDGLGYGYGVAIYGNSLKWVTNPKFGSNNFIFIENCTFDRHRHSVASAGCGLYVFRYNSVVNNYLTDNSYTHAIDSHSARGGSLGNGNYFSSRAFECYGNSIVNTTFNSGTTITSGQPIGNLTELCVALRGGGAVVYNNNISGFRFGGGIYVDAAPFGSSYPIPYSPGYLSGIRAGSLHTGTDSRQGEDDVWFYNNTFWSYSGSGGNNAQYFNLYTSGGNVYASGYLASDRDYHQSTNSSAAKPNYSPFMYPHPLRSS